MKFNELKARDEIETWIRNHEQTMINPHAITLTYIFDTGAVRAPSEAQFKKDMNSLAIRLRNRWYHPSTIKRHHIQLNFTPFKLETAELVGLHGHGIIDVPKHIKHPHIGVNTCWSHGNSKIMKCDGNGFSDYICKIRTSCHFDNFQDNFHFIEWK